MVQKDDDDCDDDETTQNKLLFLVAKDVKTRTYPATCLREKGVSDYATSWLVFLLRRLEYSRAQDCDAVGISICCVSFA